MTERIDIVTTALCRPDLLDLTYRTFFGRLLGLPRVRIIINVDPLGYGSAADCVKVASKFSSEICWRCPKTPGFMSAVQWCYNQAESEIVLHLEDDWFLKRRLNYLDWLQELTVAQAAQCVLPMKAPRQNSKLTYSFRPNLCRREQVQNALKVAATSGMNPEQYLRNYVPTLTSIDFNGAGPRLISDMGRKWAKSCGLLKTDQNNLWFDARPKTLLGMMEYSLLRQYWRLTAPAAPIL